MRIGQFLTTVVGAMLTALGPVWAQGSERGYGYGHMWDGGGWGHFFLGPLMMILVVAAIVVIVILLVRWIGGLGSGGATTAAPARRALDILEERYARGEIDRDEYLQKKKDLG